MHKVFLRRKLNHYSVLNAAMSSQDGGLEEKLTCSICLQLFREPRLLPCGHTYCHHCLNSYICSRPSSSSSRGQQGFPCPVCRELVPAPDRFMPVDQWAASFKPNFLIRDIVEMHGRSKKSDQGPSCSRHPNKILELYCRDCKTPACDRCVALTHRRCQDVLELATVARETQEVAKQHHQTVVHLLRQLDAKKRRCANGLRELQRIEHDMESKIDREGQDILRKVTDFLRMRKESLKRQARGYCRSRIGIVHNYMRRCDELSNALHTLDKTVCSKMQPDLPYSDVVDRQEESSVVKVMVKLNDAVQKLDTPSHFTVRLIMDDTPLTSILSNLELMKISTDEHEEGRSPPPEHLGGNNRGNRLRRSTSAVNICPTSPTVSSPATASLSKSTLSLNVARGEGVSDSRADCADNSCFVSVEPRSATPFERRKSPR